MASFFGRDSGAVVVVGEGAFSFVLECNNDVVWVVYEAVDECGISVAIERLKRGDQHERQLFMDLVDSVAREGGREAGNFTFAHTQIGDRIPIGGTRPSLANDVEFDHARLVLPKAILDIMLFVQHRCDTGYRSRECRTVQWSACMTNSVDGMVQTADRTLLIVNPYRWLIGPVH
jgi:hypothetical protein